MRSVRGDLCIDVLLRIYLLVEPWIDHHSIIKFFIFKKSLQTIFSVHVYFFHQIGGVELNSLKSALGRLRSGVEIWINGSASAPLLYDTHWGGLISCGCDFDGDTQDCRNQYPNCPAMTDAGQNFGHGFYNDHHFHYGYHIYAAAVVAKFDYAWARRHHEHVMTMVRDIANPSPEDPYFPTWRHKDW